MMIIEKISNIKNVEEFIRKYQDGRILLLNKMPFQDYETMMNILKNCEKVNDFLKIEIEENFYYIEKTDIKSGEGCPYFLSERKIKDIIQEVNHVQF